MKIAILGTAPLSIQRAPYDDKEWKVWVCSAGNMGKIPRVDAWFELHAIVDLLGKENQAWVPQYFGWLKTQSFPVYMQEPNDLLPQSVVFPWKVLVEKFGRNWFTSSVAWMFAYALHLGATDIGLFGVDMAADYEHYTHQRAALQRFFEIAQERGVRVHVPFESCLGAPPALYGYAEATNMGRRLVVMEQGLQEQITNLQQQIRGAELQLATMQGSIENVKYMRRTFVDGTDAVLDTAPATSHVDAQRKGNGAMPPDLGTSDFKLGSGGVWMPPQIGESDPSAQTKAGGSG